MKGSNTVLVLGQNERSNAVETLFDQGYIPLVRKNILTALESVRHADLGAILIDCRHLKDDMLEFVLNVRDIDKDTPIVAFGATSEQIDHASLLNQQGVVVMPDVSPSRTEIEAILASN